MERGRGPVFVGCMWLAGIAAPAQGAPVALPDTERFALVHPGTGVEYRIDVALPRDYARDDTRHPLVLTLDADYAFALTRNVLEHFSDRERLPPAVVVSVGYPGGIESLQEYRRRRTRDYTPTHTLEGGYGPEIQRLSGGGPAFLAFLREVLRPELHRRYRLRERDWTFVGHSYGGLFGSWLVATEPSLFQRYLLVSPSLWFDDRLLLRVPLAKLSAGASPRVFLAVGAQENPIMARDLREFVQRLCRADVARVGAEVFPEENHDSVFPAALSRGLRFLDGRVGASEGCTD